MAERRQATRREPIEVEVRGKVFTAEPLPWQQGNDLGDEIMRQNVQEANEAISMYVTDLGTPQIDLHVMRKINDWGILLKMAYPTVPVEDWESLAADTDECAELILAALDVNHLSHLRHLVDPNFPALMTPGGNDTSEGQLMTDGQKTGSLLSSILTASPEIQSSPSAEESSSQS